MPRRVRLAVLLAFILHGILVLTAQYRLSFDAYTHMFFADHYRLDWWSLWEPRWYTGFSVASYPPLVHQVMGLLGRAIGVDAAFAIVLWTVLTAYPVAVYAFSRAFTGRSAAGYAAIGAALLPSAYLAAHTFGQLPTLAATLFALFGIAALAEFLRHGNRLSGALAVSLFTVVMAAHHATLLFLPWVIAGLVVHLMLNGEVERRSLLIRLSIFLIPAVIAGLLVIWPFWAWGRGQSIQVPIDHPTRHNFLSDSFAVIAFFLPIYGPLLVVIPLALWMSRQRRYMGLGLAFLPLFVLGLGGTTPLPRWLFGVGWEWLTYDRFAFWASLLLLPLFGVAVLLVRRVVPKYLGLSLRLDLTPARNQKTPRAQTFALAITRPRRWATLGIIAFMGVISMTIGLLPTLMPFQPARIDMQPIVDYLAAGDRSQWRYLTFGFGDQLAYLSRLTKATSIDGSYHTARSLPELRASGIAQIDTAYWTVKGLPALGPILQKSGGHGVRWGFVSLPAYIPILERNGWVKLTTLSNGVQVWENPSAVLPPPSQAPPGDRLASVSWGALPLLSLAIAAGLAAMRLRTGAAQKFLFGIHHFAIGLLPVGLCFWYSFTIVNIQVPNVYFTYTDALFFASDALGLVAFLSWLIAGHFGPTAVSLPAFPMLRDLGKAGTWRLEGWFLALCLLGSLSILWSVDWRVSLYVSLHLWLAFGVFLSIRDRPEVWRAAALGMCAALMLQVFIGLWQFVAQSTAFLEPLGFSWISTLDPAERGVSVVQLPDGARWLRAYGTFAHPNILGGFILAFLAGPVAILFRDARQRAWTIALFALSMLLLVISFSRAAWLGLAAAAAILAFHHLKFERKRLLALALAGLVGLSLAAVPLSGLIFTRIGATPVATETFSNEARLWLMQQTFEMIKAHPLLGVGIGASILEYARHAPHGYLVEPVHNLPLLVGSELGLPGMLFLAGLGISILAGSLRARGLQAVVFSAVLIGLCMTALFDHYLWTLAPGRMLLGLVLGLWAGQIKLEEQDHAADSV